MQKKYEKMLRNIELLQKELMEIENYDEDTYQAFEKLIQNIEGDIEEI